MQIHEKIKAFMKKSGASNLFVARETGIHPASISLALLGKRKIAITEYVEITKALRVPVDFFLKEEDDETV